MLIENLTKLLGRSAEVVDIPLDLAYSGRMLKVECSKGFAGAAACAGIIVFLQPTPWLGWPIGIAGMLFFMYFSQQLSRRYLRLLLDETGLIHDLPGFRKAIRWSELSDLRLNFYPQTKGASKGTLVLTLKDGASKIKVDSSLDHFPTVLSRAAQAARDGGLELNPTTTENLATLGL